MTIKHIFSDMDGTLLNSEGVVSDGNAQAIQQCGIPFTLVSARAPMEMAAAIDKLQLAAPQIGFNGGLIFEQSKEGWNVLKESPMAFETSRKLIDFIKTSFPELSLSFYDLNHWYAEKNDAGIELEARLTGQEATVTDFDTVLKSSVKIFKLMMIVFDAQKMKKLIKALHSLNLSDIAIQQSGELYLEITSQEARKSQGIAYIMASERLDREETAAFGDGHNDLPMFETVGRSIVMANAAPDVQKVADFITKTNDEDGVSYGIQAYVLPAPPR